MKTNLICSLVILSFVLFLSVSCKKYDVIPAKVPDLKSITTDNKGYKNQDEYTTVDRVIYPDPFDNGKDISPWDVSLFSKYNYGKWHYGQGVPNEIKLDLMPGKYTHPTDKKTSKLLRFFTFTDIHLTDKESPAQSIFYSILYRSVPQMFTSTISCYSPAMLYSTHVLNASVQKVNELNRESPIDFGIALGDMANSSIYNEIRWFIDILDGKNINPDSGKKDDPVAGPGNDYQDKYKAEGLCKSIPWYATVGNHDHFFMGAVPYNDKVRKNLTGREILHIGNTFTEENALDLSTYSMGTIDGSTVNGNIIGTGIVADMKNFPTIPSDPNRHSLTKSQMMREFSNTSSNPRGHGFNNPNLFEGCYSFEPKSNLPFKVIVLDDTMDNNDNSLGIIGYGHGSLKNGRFEWLIKQLQAGQKEDKLMIIAAHVPIGVEGPNSLIGWSDVTAQDEIISELKKYPNLILWIAGHRHLDKVTPFQSPDMNHPENGFWEVETRSLREFPQQFRTFDIKCNSDYTLSIFATDVDPEIKNNIFSATSRSYAIAAYQIYARTENPSPANVELIKKLTPKMQEKLAKYVDFR